MRNPRHPSNFCLSALAALASLSSVWAAPLTNYNFAGGSPSSAVSDANVSPSVMTSNIGTLGTDSGFSASAGNAFVRANATQATEADAIMQDDYFEFTLTPQSGYEVDLTSFSMTVGNQTSTVMSLTSSYFVRSSRDGFGTNIGITSTGGTTTSSGGVASRTTSSNSTTVADSVVFNVSGSEFQNITAAVTFRIYLFDTGSGMDSNQSISRFDNVQVAGNVAAVPEPTAGALTLIGGLAAVFLRRRTVKAP